MRISDWSSDVCSSDLILSRSPANETDRTERGVLTKDRRLGSLEHLDPLYVEDRRNQVARMRRVNAVDKAGHRCFDRENSCVRSQPSDRRRCSAANRVIQRSEEHTSELQSLMRISYAVFCLKKKKNKPLT